MKVLILNGSPRMKGNTKAALSAVADGIREGLKPEELEIYDVSKHKLSACLACDGCKRNGGTCVQPDDTAELIQKIYDADILVFGTPVYFWGMSAQLKMVVDKLYSRDGALKKLDKKVGLVTIGAAALDDPEYKLIEDQMVCICDHFGWKLTFSYQVSAWEAGELEADEEKMSVFRGAWESMEE